MSTEVDKVNTGALGTLVVVGTFAMIAIATAVTALVRHDVELAQEAKDTDSDLVVRELKAEQRGLLNAPASYVDRGKGTVSLPIDLAKQVVVSELTRDPNSATPPAAATAEASGGSGGAPATAEGGAAAVTGGAGGTAAAPEKDEKKAAGGAKGEPGKAQPAKPAIPDQHMNAVSPGPLHQ